MEKTDNDLIAGFMGKTIQPQVGTPAFAKWGGERYDYSYYEVKYSSSYDWLMDAWIKFRDLKLSERDSDKHKQWVRSIGYTILNKTLEDACSHLVMGIKWYNEVKP